MRRNKNARVSLLKIIAASFVVFIHLRFPGDFGYGLSAIARFAVPSFIMISGYYSYKINVSALVRRLKKTIYLIIVSALLYFLWQCIWIHFFTEQSINEYCTGLFTIETVSQYLFMGRSVFSEHLWYLPSMALVYFIMIVYHRFYKQPGVINYTPLYIVAVGCFLNQIAYSVKALGTQMEVSYWLYRYCLFFTLPFFCLGLFLREYKETIFDNYSFSRIKAFLLIILGFVLSLIQWFGIGKVEMPLGMFLVVINILLLTAYKPTTKPMNRFMQAIVSSTDICSTVVYIIHPLINRITGVYKSRILLLNSVSNNGWLYPLYILFVSIVLGYCISLIYRLGMCVRHKN